MTIDKSFYRKRERLLILSIAAGRSCREKGKRGN
jgi:hypothetical protein